MSTASAVTTPAACVAPPTLTPREKEILYWCSCGKTSWEISQILACKESTVNFHVSNVLRKLSVHSRVAAVIKALRYGILRHQSDES
ncbi:helix-turn-helix transcriptional regulator [Pseudomonas putida CSV86]|uniref:Helix-turn-helix transcriptional regulator n=1 Tax=Pseudomonas bharatica CSV86 TaxID=1005395 RepID=A0A7K4EBE9_9PSED|nr:MULTISPECIES: helix-turn-helix transcriptional regulator [Pseudomonas]NNJ14972.1 helix-turn-helix transcriptional regulator [Pseudomonas bharatica CSV86]